jgi:hypothetical protein
VDFFELIRLTLAVLLTVTVAWPVNVPVMALAFKIRQGQTPVPFKPRVFWLRSAVAAFGLAVLSLVLLGFDRALILAMELPAGPIHLVMLIVYLPVAIWYLFVLFALEDMLPAVGVFVLYVCLPGLVLFLIDQGLGIAGPLGPALAWLPPVS